MSSFHPEILERQIDGNFCKDGMLNYAPSGNNLVYVFFYRNEFIKMYANLNIILSGKTIDTVSKVQIKLSAVPSDGVITMSSPALMVNHRSCVDQQNLYILKPESQ